MKSFALKIFRKGCKTEQSVAIKEAMDSMQLCVYMLGAFKENPDRFCVFEEIKEVFANIDDEKFREDHFKKAWMMKCIHFFIEFYGVAPIEVIYKMYKLKINDSMEEMIKMIWEMPVDIVESTFFSIDKLGLMDLPKDSPIYSPKGMLVHLELFREEGEFFYLLREQGDKPFYIPSIQQIEEIAQNGYETSNLAYKKLQNFLMKKLDMTYNEATMWCLMVWGISQEGGSVVEVINAMDEHGIEYKNEKQMREFVELLMKAHNNTRMRENRGHKPVELRKAK